jgi:hypothetical protein
LSAVPRKTVGTSWPVAGLTVEEGVVGSGRIAGNLTVVPVKDIDSVFFVVNTEC